MNNKITNPKTEVPKGKALNDKDYLNDKFNMRSNIRNILSYELYPKVYEDYLRQDTDNKFWLVNTNKVVY